MTRKAASRADGLALDLAARRPVPCLCDGELTTDADDVVDVRDRAGLTITYLDCRTCGRRWRRVG